MKIRAYLLPICFFSGSFSASELERPDPLELEVGGMHPVKHGSYVAQKISDVVSSYGTPFGHSIFQILKRTKFKDEPTYIKCTNYEWVGDENFIYRLETDKLEKFPQKREIYFKIILKFSEESKILNEELEKIEKELENTHFNKPE